MLYHIITEAMRIKETKNLISDHFSNATIYTGQGSWQGRWENTLIIEISSTDANDVCTGYRVGVLAKLIKVQNKQDEVLVQEIACKSSLI